MKKAITLYLLAIFVFFTVFFTSCSGKADLVLKSDDSLKINLSFSVPQAVDTWLNNFTGSSIAMTDTVMVSDAAQKAGIRVLEAGSKNKLEWSGIFQIDRLDIFCQKQHDAVPANDSGLRGSLAGSMETIGLIKYKKGSLSININRDNIALLLSIMPFADEDLLDALMPPALYDNPASKSQYRAMLQAFMGSRVIEAVDAAIFSFSIRLPSPIIELGGPSAILSADRLEAGFSIPALDLMVLEKPVLINLLWQE